VKYLVENGVNTQIPNRNGLTPFDFAEDAKKQMNMNLINNKQKKSDQDMAKLSQAAESLDAIMRILKPQEWGGQRSTKYLDWYN